LMGGPYCTAAGLSCAAFLASINRVFVWVYTHVNVWPVILAGSVSGVADTTQMSR
jgi:hypothetical protein